MEPHSATNSARMNALQITTTTLMSWWHSQTTLPWLPVTQDIATLQEKQKIALEEIYVWINATQLRETNRVLYSSLHSKIIGVKNSGGTIGRKEMG